MTQAKRAKDLETWAWTWIIEREHPWFWHSQLVTEARKRGARQEDVDRLIDSLKKEGKLYVPCLFSRGCIGVRA